MHWWVNDGANDSLQHSDMLHQKRREALADRPLPIQADAAKASEGLLHHTGQHNCSFMPQA